MSQHIQPTRFTKVVETNSKKGRATFATTTIPGGTLIFSEEPILTMDATSETPHIDLLPSFAALSEELQELILDLTAIDPTSFRHLVWKEFEIRPRGSWWDINQKHGEHIKQVLAAFNTNAVGQHLGIHTAMLNHSCLPNAYAAFDEATGEMAVHATKEIKEGEEVCLSHLEGPDLFAPMNERRGLLVVQRGFTCLCDACMEAEQCESTQQESPREKLRAELRNLIDKYRRNEATLMKKFGKGGHGGLDPDFVTFLGEVAAGVVELVERLGLATIDNLDWYEYVIRWSLAMKNGERATEYGKKMVKVVYMSVGGESQMHGDIEQHASGAKSVAWRKIAKLRSKPSGDGRHSIMKTSELGPAEEDEVEQDGEKAESREQEENPNDGDYEDEDLEKL
ncbi:SET domain-containing protein 5 [Paraconiothyrium brasiliense]|uniref:SET domain-containing protein 5 n=1 Tax=Paraconiothyrium brasiliense TaxID=300254 RepID=A0ABR3R6A8_9PLEO